MFASMHVHHLCAVTMGTRRGASDPPGIGVTEVCELLCWEPNLSPLQEQSVLLTTELYLRPCLFVGCVCVYVYVSVIVYMWKSKSSLWESILSFYHLGLGIEFRSLGMTASISPAQFFNFYNWKSCPLGGPLSSWQTRISGYPTGRSRTVQWRTRNYHTIGTHRQYT